MRGNVDLTEGLAFRNVKRPKPKALPALPWNRSRESIAGNTIRINTSNTTFSRWHNISLSPVHWYDQTAYDLNDLLTYTNNSTSSTITTSMLLSDINDFYIRYTENLTSVTNKITVVYDDLVNKENKDSLLPWDHHLIPLHNPFHKKCLCGREIKFPWLKKCNRCRVLEMIHDKEYHTSTIPWMRNIRYVRSVWYNDNHRDRIPWDTASWHNRMNKYFESDGEPICWYENIEHLDSYKDARDDVDMSKYLTDMSHLRIHDVEDRRTTDVFDVININEVTSSFTEFASHEDLMDNEVFMT